MLNHSRRVCRPSPRALRSCPSKVSFQQRLPVSRCALAAFVSLVFAFSLAEAAGSIVSVDPVNGRDVPDCNVTLPCQTIEYALNSRHATSVHLSSGTFTESGIRVDRSVRIVGKRDTSVLDCNLVGPALIARNASVSISGITFQNCVNDRSAGAGGAISADGSAVEVSNCNFYNNAAGTGGAIAVESGTLIITSSLFQNNTAGCLNCSTAWGGAVSAVASASVTLANNTFVRNTAGIECSGATIGGCAAGGGCVSVMHHGNVSESAVVIHNNTFRACTARVSQSTISKINPVSAQHGNTYGGAVSVYYGLKPTLLLVVSDALSSFTNNVCRDCSSLATAGIAGNAYGGCLSVYTGAWSVSTVGKVSEGSVLVEGMRAKVIGNDFVNCTAIAARSSLAYGSNVYGGGVSFAVGLFLYSDGGTFSGNTTYANSSYTISNNTLTSCTASSSTACYSSSSSVSSSSSGTNVYGGGLSLVLGTFKFSRSSGASSFSGNTADANSSYTISNNTLTSCSASSSTASATTAYFYDFVASSVSSGSNAYGGGISLAVGAYSYSRGDSEFKGNTNISSSSYTISNNILTNCTASTSTASSANQYPSVSTSISSGLASYGGGISLMFGSYFYSGGSIGGEYIGSTSVSSSIYTISNNTLTNCSATSSTSSSSAYSSLSSYSNGAATYGGGISLITGSYIYGQQEIMYFGDTLGYSVSYSIAGNSLTNCLASAFTMTFSAFSSSASGTNSNGGGICVVLGAYHYKKGTTNYVGKSSVSSSSCTISNNTLTNCTASSSTSALSTVETSSSTNGANVYGGGILAAVGSYHYSKGSSVVIESTSVISSIYAITGNILTNCSVLSSTMSSTLSPVLFEADFSASAMSNGANVYGGGVSVLVGSYHFIGGGSSYTGYLIVSSSSYTISNNTLANCTASSQTSGSFFNSSIFSKGANAYGGALSNVVGSYVYNLAVSWVTDGIIVSNNSYVVAGNFMYGCKALSSTSSSSATSSLFSSFSDGTNTYGGGVSLLFGSYYYGAIDTKFEGSLEISLVSILLSDSSFLNCISEASTSGVSSETVSFGGAVSVVFDYSVHSKRLMNTSLISATSSALQISRCRFNMNAALSCSPGSSSAAGGTVFISILAANATIFSSDLSDSFVGSVCTASLSKTYCLGGGIAVLRAGGVVINATNLTKCIARGNRQAINVFVSGGGIFVQSSASFALESSFISFSKVEDAFSVLVIACGGGAMGTRNVPIVRISNSKLYNNSDASLSGVILLQQLDFESGMVVDITNESILTTNPAISDALPALNISCGSNFTLVQQKRLQIHFQNSSLLVQTPNGQLYQSAIVASLPRWATVSSANSSVYCDFLSVRGIAILVRKDSDRHVLSCSPCDKPLSIAATSRTMDLSALSQFVDQAATADSCHPAVVKSAGDEEQHCPFGFFSCTTTVNITVGFWAKFKTDGNVSDATLCPSNYCGCRNIPGYAHPSCQLFPPFAAEYQPEDALCSGNRTGVLCGGCKPNFTQSLNGHSCISNEFCAETWPWVWTITVLGYMVYAIYIVITSVKINSGLIMCVLFYGQLSSFASLPSQLIDKSSHSQFSQWFSQVTQFNSVLSLYEGSCYGLNMGAYEATAAQLCGPAIVLASSLLFTAAAKRLLPKISRWLQEHKFNVRVCFRATMINVLLLLFSSVSSVIFQLITCQKVDQVYVVFIDGRRTCDGPLHSGLIAAAALLSLQPALFWILLKFNKIPATARSTVCSAYTESRHHWAAIALLFRFLMTVVFATARDFPSMTAFALCMCSVGMLVLLMAFKPYVEQRTHCMDLLCYICLIVQFALQVVVRDSESLGIAVLSSNSYRQTIRKAARASEVLRYVPFAVCAILILLDTILLWMWKRGFISSRFVRNRSMASASIAQQPSNEDIKSNLL